MTNEEDMKAQNIALETEPVKELKYQIESKSGLPDALTHIIECISFWNKEGVICHQNSKTTIWPDEQKIVRARPLAMRILFYG